MLIRYADGRLLLAWSLMASPLVAHANFSFADFTTVDSLKLNGSATVASGELRLTSASGSGTGSAFTTTPVELGNSNSFSTHFRFRINNSLGSSDEDGPGADGIVFVVQTVSNSVGGAGGFIGYGGIGNSVGVEFDTYNNGVIGNDPNGNHVGVDLGGSIASLVAKPEPIRFNNGNVWNAWIDYDGPAGKIDVRWSQAADRPFAAQLSYSTDLVSVLGQSTAFAGFTSGTAGGVGDHSILSWEFAGAVPEPTTSVLFTLGALVASMQVIRKRGRRETTFAHLER